MNVVRLTAVCGALVLLASPGCKKDEPTPEAGKAQSGEQQPEAAKATEKAGEVDTPTKAGKTQSPTATKTKPAQSAPKMPANVFGYIALPGLDNLLELVETQAKKLGVPLPPEANSEVALAQVGVALGMKDMKWWDRKGPSFVIGVNPKIDESALLVLPITDSASVLAALPESAAKDVEGNAASLTIIMGQTGYLNFVSKYVVLSAKPNLFPMVKDYLGALLKDYEHDGLAAGSLNVANVRNVFKDELTQGLAEMRAAKSEIEKEIMRDLPPMTNLTGVGKMLEFIFKAVETVATEAEQTAFSVHYDKNGHLSVPLTVQTKANGKLGKLMASAKANTDISFVGKAPKNSWALSGGRTDPTLFQGMTGWMVDIMSSSFKLDEAEKTAIQSHVATLMKLQDGTNWSAFYADGSFPIAVAGSAGVTDGAKYKTTMDAYMGLVFKKVMSMAKTTLPPNLQALEGQSFVQIIGTLNAITKNMGVTLTATDEKKGDVSLQSLSLTVDVMMLEKIAGPDDAAEVKKVTSLLGNKVEFALATGAKHVGMAFGPNAVKTATSIADGSFNGGSTVAGSLKPGMNAFIHVDASQAIATFLPLVKQLDPEVELPKFPAGVEFGLAAGSIGTRLAVELYANADKMVEAAQILVKMDERGSAPAVIADPTELPVPAPSDEAPAETAPAP